MPTTLALAVVEMYCRNHRLILALADKMTDEQLRWRHNPGALSAAFHLWHIARWADYMQVAIPGMTPELRRQFGARRQLWDVESLAVGWGFTQEQLGYSATGMDMSDEVAATLSVPDKSLLLDYAARAFAAVDEVVRAIDEAQLHEPEQPQPITEGVWSEGTVGASIAEHVTHEYRHMGAMECLYGLQVGSGTATR